MTTAAPATGVRTLRLGTRASDLAMTQTRSVAEALREAGVPAELVPISTQGDTDLRPLPEIGGTGVFTSVLRAALLAGDIDVAVHSLKDLPTAPEPGLALAAVPRRAPVHDVLISTGEPGLAALREGAVVGTGSPRRRAQLLAARPDLRVVDIRGNVDTRMSRVGDTVDAVVLAAAGLTRLGHDLPTGLVAAPLDPQVFVPAPGQGALAVETRLADDEALAACAVLDDVDTRRATTAEREVLAALEAGCTAPVGALAQLVDVGPGSSTLSLRAQLADLPGGVRDATGDPDHPHRLGRTLAEELLRLRSQATAAHSQWADDTMTERDT